MEAVPDARNAPMLAANTSLRNKGHPALTVARTLTIGLVLDAKEAHTMDFSATWTATRIGGWPDADFWSRNVLQLCKSEPFASNAALAISALYRNFMNGEASAEEPLRFYNRAVRATRHRVEANALYPALAATSCALFVCIEFLRDNIAAARSLLVQGIQLLRSLASDEPHVSFFRSLLIRLNVLAATFGDPSAANIEIEMSSSQPDTFVSVAEARSSLFDIMAESHSFLKEAMAWKVVALEIEITAGNGDGEHGRQASILAARQSSLQHKLDNWQATLYLKTTPTKAPASSPRYTTPTTSTPALTHSPPDTTSFLPAYHHTSRIWLQTRLDTPQTSFDRLTPALSHALNHAEIYINARAAEQTHLKFESGAIPILYPIAIRCRIPSLRRR